jgi:hypothetical protein
LPAIAHINNEISSGNFTEASKLIKIRLMSDTLPEIERWNLNFELEKMDRIRYDFRASDSSESVILRDIIPTSQKVKLNIGTD